MKHKSRDTYYAKLCPRTQQKSACNAKPPSKQPKNGFAFLLGTCMFDSDDFSISIAVKINFCTNDKFALATKFKKENNQTTTLSSSRSFILMGSTRSPNSSPLDPHSPYTQSAASKRKSSRSDYDDHSFNNSHEHGYGHDNNNNNNNISDDDNESQRRHSASGSSKKKKKSKREKERHKDRHYNDSDSDNQYARSTAITSTSAPTQKLPPIKISLRLPALSSIVTSSSSLSSASHKASSRKKIRTDYDSEDDHLRRRHETREYSDPEPEAPSSSSHKKKKKKHKHKHRHPNHEDEDDVDHGRRDSRREHSHHYQDTTGDYEEDHEQDEDDHEAGTRRPSASKLTLRLGKTDKDQGKERRSSKKSHKNHPSEERHTQGPSPQSHYRSGMRSPPSQRQSPPPPSRPTPVHTHQRSMSSSSRNHPLSPVEVKQDYQWPQPPPPSQSMEHMQVGQKRPFAVLQNQRSVSQDIDNELEAEEEDLDDPLAGELDEPEDYDEDDDDDEEDDNDGEDQQSDDNDTRSPSIPNSSQFGSKTVGQLGSKTVPRSTSVPAKSRKSKTPKDVGTREGSVTASSTTTKSKRKGKAAKRLMSPKSSTPAIPKKKELSAVCHKLLDQFIKYGISWIWQIFENYVSPITQRSSFTFLNC